MLNTRYNRVESRYQKHQQRGECNFPPRHSQFSLNLNWRDLLTLEPVLSAFYLEPHSCCIVEFFALSSYGWAYCDSIHLKWKCFSIFFLFRMEQQMSDVSFFFNLKITFIESMNRLALNFKQIRQWKKYGTKKVPFLPDKQQKYAKRHCFFFALRKCSFDNFVFFIKFSPIFSVFSILESQYRHRSCDSKKHPISSAITTKVIHKYYFTKQIYQLTRKCSLFKWRYDMVWMSEVKKKITRLQHRN